MLIFLFPLQAENFNFDFSGEAYFFNTISQEKDTNSYDYNSVKIDNVKNNIFINLKFYNKKNIAGLASLNFNTDFSYYSFYADRAFVTYFQDKRRLKLFYRERILDFNDGLRLLDEESINLYQPIIFYREPIERTAYFGRDYYGAYFEMENNILNQRICFAGSYRDSNLKYLIANKTEFKLSSLLLSANIIYKQEDYTLPKVNESSWAEVDGVWYEFNTNSFYDPDEPDNEIKSTLEVSYSLKDLLTFWAEGGIKKKSGGYYGRMTMEATSDGNIPVQQELNSPSLNYTVAGLGVKFNIDSFLGEVNYKIYSGENKEFSFLDLLNKLYIITNKPNYNEVKMKLKYDSNMANLNLSVWMGKTEKDSVRVWFDEYNFDYRYYYRFCNSVTGIKSYNNFDFGFLKYIPSAEYRKYESDYNDTTTFEANNGLDFDLTQKIEAFFNVRYKSYLFKESVSISRHFWNIFLGVKYKINSLIYLGLDYGIDPRLIYDKDYGFEYSLISHVDEGEWSDAVNTIFDGENYFANNHFITLRAYIRF